MWVHSWKKILISFNCRKYSVHELRIEDGALKERESLREYHCRLRMFGSVFRRGGGGSQPPAGGIGSGYSTPQTPDYEKIGPTRILPHLYIGCAKDALSSETREVSVTIATLLG